MNSNRKLKIFSFFSGCGILDLGFENAGYDIELVNEFYKPFIEAYQYSREKMGIRKPSFGCFDGDINIFLRGSGRKQMKSMMKEARVDGSLVGFIGGPPCPDFSIAGKQRGKDGDNGKLTLSYFNLIVGQKPDFFLFENVKGLWKTARHRAFYDEMRALAQSKGYCISDRLVNSLEFGVPQERERILMVGVKKSLLKKKYYTEDLLLKDFPWEENMRYSLENIKKITWPNMDPFVEGVVTRCPEGIIKEITVEYWFEKNDVEHHPDAGRFFSPKAGLIKMQELQEGDSNKKSYKRIHRWRYSPTVAYGNNEVHLHPYKARRLSVAESMSLQSLPKEFCLPPQMTLTDCFKTIGNGVPYMMAKGIAMSLKGYLYSSVK
ncbi:DNA cytosine methyltransferase [Alistipes putredinis]|uniref:DNA cytosine methyltransferase n=1 Tax=Alistipes putredinis TaxID=28117 RepID=UPI003AB2236F